MTDITTQLAAFMKAEKRLKLANENWDRQRDLGADLTEPNWELSEAQEVRDTIASQLPIRELVKQHNMMREALVRCRCLSDTIESFGTA